MLVVGLAAICGYCVVALADIVMAVQSDIIFVASNQGGGGEGRTLTWGKHRRHDAHTHTHTHTHTH